MIIRNATSGQLAEAVTELEFHYLGFDPSSPALRSEGKAPLMLFDKKQWESATVAPAPFVGVKRTEITADAKTVETKQE